MRQLVSALYRRACTLLRQHQEVLRRGAALLLENEVLEGAELERLLDEMDVARPVRLDLVASDGQGPPEVSAVG